MYHDAEIAVYYEYVILPQTDFLEVSIGQSNMVAYWLHKSIDPGTPKTILPFWKEQGYLIFLSVACPKFHCFLVVLRNSQWPLPQNRFSIGLMNHLESTVSRRPTSISIYQQTFHSTFRSADILSKVIKDINSIKLPHPKSNLYKTWVLQRKQ